MIRLAQISAAIALSLSFAIPASAQSEKEQDCTYQAEVVAAVQKARMDGVPQDKVVETVKSSQGTWPDRYDNAIPIFAAQIYSLKKRQLRKADLGKEWLNTCLTN